MLLKHIYTWVELNISIKDNTCITCHRNCASIDLPTFHIALVEIFIIVCVKTTSCNLVKSYRITIGDQSRLGWIGVAHKKLGNRNGSTGEHRRIGAKLRKAERFSCLAWA